MLSKRRTACSRDFRCWAHRKDRTGPNEALRRSGVHVRIDRCSVAAISYQTGPREGVSRRRCFRHRSTEPVDQDSMLRAIDLAKVRNQRRRRRDRGARHSRDHQVELVQHQQRVPQRSSDKRPAPHRRSFAAIEPIPDALLGGGSDIHRSCDCCGSLQRSTRRDAQANCSTSSPQRGPGCASWHDHKLRSLGVQPTFGRR